MVPRNRIRQYLNQKPLLKPPPGLMMGWDSVNPNVPCVYAGDAPLLTCGMTGSGKGRSALIPTLLTYPGPVIVPDVKGELYQVTCRRRREMGQTAVALDPCRLVTQKSDGLNPFDMVMRPGSDRDEDARMIAAILAAGHQSASDPYWHTMASSLLAGLISFVTARFRPEERTFKTLRDFLYSQDFDELISVAIEGGKDICPFASSQFSSYMAAPQSPTRACIRGTLCSYLNAFCSDSVIASLSRSSFRLQDVVDGKPLTIYIVSPADKLESLSPLWRLWIGTLLTAVQRRRVIPKQRTLFLLDECAQLGELSALRQAVTLLRGSGLTVWSFWQDLSQLRQNYPRDWETMLNNAGAIQLLSVPNNLMAREWGDIMGVKPSQLLRLSRNEAVVSGSGFNPRLVRKLDYLTDPLFAGLFDPNPRFSLLGPP
jgi:type IV secretion system protein VirD4